MNFGIFLFWLMVKLGWLKRYEQALSKLSFQDLEFQIRHQLEKLSDKELDKAIEDTWAKDWPLEPYASLLRCWNKVGITLDTLLQWADDEKYLREHRKGISHVVCENCRFRIPVTPAEATLITCPRCFCIYQKKETID